MNFKDKLLYVRANLNLSQKQLANELNVSFETINRWENEKVSPSKKAVIVFDIFCQRNNINFSQLMKEM